METAINERLQRTGWAMSNGQPFPLTLRVDLDTAELDPTVRDGLTTCLERYRNGDMDGAMTAICGIVDSITEQIYTKKNLGSYSGTGYQERVNRAFRAMEQEFTRPLAACLSKEEVLLYGNNHKNAISGAAYVLGTYRAEFSDTHGARVAPENWYNAL